MILAALDPIFTISLVLSVVGGYIGHLITRRRKP